MAKYTFSTVPTLKRRRSRFDRNHSYTTTMNEDYLVPFFVDEALPGDTFNLDFSIFGRMLTPIEPVFDDIYLDYFFFAVPNRLVWTNWERFNGARDNPAQYDNKTVDSYLQEYLVPVATSPSSTGYAVQSLQDYLGIPTGVAGLEHTNLFCRAYNLIWNEWFRDENLQNSVQVDVGDGPDTPSDYILLKRNKKKDYFTSALPWPQKGPTVNLPLGDEAPVVFGNLVSNVNLVPTYSGSPTVAGTQAFGRNDSSSYPNLMGATGTGTNNGYPLIADLSDATAATINSLREAIQIQSLFERDGIGGTRYTEILASHFGVYAKDSRLQRPEYLGGGMLPLIINPVVQTSSTDNTTPQGNLAAYGYVGGSQNGFVKSFTEHTLLIGLLNIRTNNSYQQGLNRMFSRRTRFEFYWPEFAHLGQQAILNKEIYAQGTAADNQVFGYQDRYNEYRYYPNMITGKMRSTANGSLDVWHLAQNFGSLPTLNSAFVTQNSPISRVVAVQNEPHFFINAYFKCRCARPMPMYGTPGLGFRL